MLAIRMQRTGRSGHAQFRLVAQDSRFSPTSGRVVEYLGSYDPHTKTATIDKEKAAEFLKNGAQPSPRAAKLLKSEGVKLPSWVATQGKKTRDIRNPEKLRRNRPAEAVAPKEEDASSEATAEEATTVEEAPAETTEAPNEEAKTEEAAPEAEAPAKESKDEEKPAEPEAAAEESAPETDQK